MNDSSVCPDAGLLERFLSGRASREEAGRVNAHMTACADCRRALDARRAAMTTAEGDAPRTSEDATIAPTLTPGPLPHGANGEAFPFLAPPQAADEMGRLGPYRVLRVLGAGGMGVVFEAEDPKLQRRVALKVMRTSGPQQSVFRERFLREARAAARLEHDHVVPVYQVDEDRGVLFLAMPLLRGETLEDRLVREPKPPPAEVLRVGREIAEGLDAAHSHGLIHRDIKPSNVWLEAGRGRVKLLDFGLARIQDEGDNQLTQEGLVMGTPAFMAPEQAWGKPVDARCDLFSLGCILYRMVTGRNPFQGVNPFSLMVAVTTAEPPAPSAIEPGVSPALADLIVRLLAKEPDGRPASARDVADRIAVIEKGGPPTEFVPAAGRKSDPIRRPHRRALFALLGLLVVLGAAAAAVWRYSPRITGMFSRPAVPDGGSPPAPAAAQATGDPLTGVALVGRPAPQPGVLAWTVETRGCRGPVRGVACSPVGPVLATAGADGSVRLWDQETGRLLRVLLAHEGGVRFVAWSGDGKRLAALGSGGMLDLWDPESGRLLQSLRVGPARTLAWSPDGARMAAGGDKRIHLWDAESGKQLQSLEGQVGESRALAWSPDGKTLAAVGADRVVRLWDVGKGRDPRTLPAEAGAEAASAAWSADGKLLAVGLADFAVQVWDVAAADRLLKLLPAAAPPDKDRNTAPGVAWAPKGRTLAVIGPGGAQTWAPPFDKPAHTVAGPGTAVSWSGDGRRLATGEEDAGARVWDLSAPIRAPLIATIPAYKLERIRAQHWSPDGKHVALEGERTVWLLSAATGRLTHTLHGPAQEITALAWSADSRRLAAAGGWDHQVYVWDAGTGKLSRTYTSPQPECEITALAWSPDDRTLAVGVDRPVEVPLWDVEANKTPVVLTGQHVAAVNALLWIDAKTLVTGSADDSGVFWNAETGKAGRTIRPGMPGGARPVTALVLAPDGKSFAAGLGRSVDHAARMFNIASERPFLNLRGPGVAVGELTWLPGGQALAGRSEDGVLRFWDAESGEATRTLTPPAGVEYFLPERGVGASSSFAFTLRYWRLEDQRPEMTVALLQQGDSTQWLAVSGDGHYAASKELEQDVVYVVRTEAGMQTLSPKEFAAAYPWKNDPERVGLPAAGK